MLNYQRINLANNHTWITWAIQLLYVLLLCKTCFLLSVGSGMIGSHHSCEDFHL